MEHEELLDQRVIDGAGDAQYGPDRANRTLIDTGWRLSGIDDGHGQGQGPSGLGFSFARNVCELLAHALHQGLDAAVIRHGSSVSY